MRTLHAPSRSPLPATAAWRPSRRRARAPGLLAALALSALSAFPTFAAAAVTPVSILHGYAAESAAEPSAARGQAFFTTRHGREWACASCHTTHPAAPGRHAATAREIAPLAPAATPTRFTDPARVEKWFRRNCRDVVGRECSAGEKADILAWLLTVKP